MDFVKFLGFKNAGRGWDRISLFFITLFAIVGLQHFIAQPILSASNSISNAIAPSSLISLITQTKTTQTNEQIIAQNPAPETSPGENSAITTLTEEQKAQLDQILAFASVFGLLVYIFTSFCLMKIADKLAIPNSWLAWVPIAQIWVMVRAAGKPGWWLILLFVPLVNIVIGLIVLFSIPTNLGKSGLLGLLVFVPIIGIFLYWGMLVFM